jgi:succinyl-diaminopimelate desuccinylase
MVHSQIEDIFSAVENKRDEILATFMEMLRIPALAPVNGGEGEGRKAEYLISVLEKLGMDDITVHTAEDTHPRPNVIAVKHGLDRSRRLWVMSHMDVVPPGDLSRWESDPFEPVVKDGKVIARGTEDNGQELIASIFGLVVLKELGITPVMDIGLALVADEETGSEFGIRYLMDRGIFRPDDLIIVPDAGNEDATELEVAEKSILWVKVITHGKQCHASTPHRGSNAHFAGMKFGVRAIEELKARYPGTNSLFDPPISTFEPTKKEGNVPNINTLPGEDIMYFDCRILPEIDPDEVLDLLRSIASEIGSELGVTIDLEIVQLERAAPPTPADAPVVTLLEGAVRKVWNNEPRPRGIGGGTCAAILRRAGFPAVVWGRIDETAHAPNEYTRIENLIGNTKVYALLYAGL